MGRVTERRRVSRIRDGAVGTRPDTPVATRGVGIVCVCPLLAPPHQERTPVEVLVRHDGHPSSRR
ncbi:hypothetical protein FNV66_13095 [Streptomyces sp. S1D4-14]|nr:hypothetical protein FNV67_13500 [Streptomyces sp. S1D4-20]QDN66348.1 hypothetical protein FNV66_13095 [Streptomyces sp. S1D4-14]QDO48756.1 hypothetical protein FNV60_11350 [Streptomyces sp. RLB3-5]QDO58996.1 hypothetical protein FNV59_13590 [Streptomyces sp. RLB1-8]